MKQINPEIKQIQVSEALPIRHKVMWPKMPIEYVKLKNDAIARHYGLYIGDEIVSIISLFTENNEVQFRKFATLIKFQGLGYGTILLSHIIDLIEKEKVNKIWCNARVEKINFYKKFGLNPTDHKFVKGGIEYTIMQKTTIANNNLD